MEHILSDFPRKAAWQVKSETFHAWKALNLKPKSQASVGSSWETTSVPEAVLSHCEGKRGWIWNSMCKTHYLGTSFDKDPQHLFLEVFPPGLVILPVSEPWLPLKGRGTLAFNLWYSHLHSAWAAPPERWRWDCQISVGRRPPSSRGLRIWESNCCAHSFYLPLLLLTTPFIPSSRGVWCCHWVLGGATFPDWAGSHLTQSQLGSLGFKAVNIYPSASQMFFPPDLPIFVCFSLLFWKSDSVGLVGLERE